MGREGVETGDSAIKRPTCQASGIVPDVLISVFSADDSAHVLMAENLRVGANPSHDGAGRVAEVFLNLPISASENFLGI